MDKRYNVACVPGKRRQEKVNKQIELLEGSPGVLTCPISSWELTLSAPSTSDEEKVLAKTGYGSCWTMSPLLGLWSEDSPASYGLHRQTCREHHPSGASKHLH